MEKKKKDIVMNKETMERLGVEDVPPPPPKDPLAEDQQRLAAMVHGFLVVAQGGAWVEGRCKALDALRELVPRIQGSILGDTLNELHSIYRSDSPPKVKDRVIKLLGKLQDVDWLSGLRPPNRRLRKALVRAYGSTHYIKGLVELLLAEHDPEVWCKIAQEVESMAMRQEEINRHITGRRWYADHRDFLLLSTILVQGLNNPSKTVVQAVGKALVALPWLEPQKTEGVTSAAATSAPDEDEDIEARIGRALEGAASPEEVQKLTEMLGFEGPVMVTQDKFEYESWAQLSEEVDKLKRPWSRIQVDGMHTPTGPRYVVTLTYPVDKSQQCADTAEICREAERAGED